MTAFRRSCIASGVAFRKLCGTDFRARRSALDAREASTSGSSGGSGHAERQVLARWAAVLACLSKARSRSGCPVASPRSSGGSDPGSSMWFRRINSLTVSVTTTASRAAESVREALASSSRQVFAALRSEGGAKRKSARASFSLDRQRWIARAGFLGGMVRKCAAARSARRIAASQSFQSGDEADGCDTRVFSDLAGAFTRGMLPKSERKFMSKLEYRGWLQSRFNQSSGMIDVLCSRFIADTMGRIHSGYAMAFDGFGSDGVGRGA